MKTNSYISNLYCPKCGKTFEFETVRNLCQCGSPLLVKYDLEKLKKEVKREYILGRKHSLWRYKELLPVIEEENIVSLGEGYTPLTLLKNAGKAIGVKNLFLKDEGIIPTGSFKARGAAVGVSKAKELGVDTVTMPTNGNAGAAWALYSAKAGIKAKIVMPEGAPPITRNEISVSGADVYLVKGLISDCGKIVKKAVDKYGWYDVSTLKEPYRIEGKKTMGLEIAEQLNWKVPDVILYPTGGGVGIIGIYKALKELRELGWIGEKLPRLVSVQSSGCAPIVKAFEAKASESQFWERSKTIAFGINVPKALGDFLVLEAIYDTGGTAVSVEDDEIIEAVKELASLEGAYVCPEGAATYAAAGKLRAEGWIGEEESVVLLNTGAGIKYPEILSYDLPYVGLDSEL